ncbi:MAG: hypothetical protein AB1705_25260 [Verrucomicrobiota bacterium]
MPGEYELGNRWLIKRERLDARLTGEALSQGKWNILPRAFVTTLNRPEGGAHAG